MTPEEFVKKYQWEAYEISRLLNLNDNVNTRNNMYAVVMSILWQDYVWNQSHQFNMYFPELGLI